MIGQTVSHYRITKLLGEGGMGVVYEARDLKLDRSVALKFLPPELTRDPRAKARFLNEAKAASALDHPNVCTIHEIGETDDGRLFLAMSRYEGRTLKERLVAGPLPMGDAVAIACQVASGLAKAHERGVIHRDVKPANIFLTTDGEVKILDFGLAKLADTTQLTRTHSLLGTPQYMSPEQARGKTISSRSDLWSLGVVLYEMLAGRVPFAGERSDAVMYAICHEKPRELRDIDPGIPAELERIVASCLEKVESRRYSSSAALLRDLGTFAATSGSFSSAAARTLMMPDKRRGFMAGRRVRALVAMVAVVLVIGGAFARLATRDSSPYTTDVRMAVMPFANKVHPAHDRLLAGLTETAYRVLDDASRRQGSMWVVPDRLVRYSQLSDPVQCRAALGVNRVVTGELQRFGPRLRLVLDLRDASSLRSRRTASLVFDPEAPTALADSFRIVVAGLMDIGAAGEMPGAVYLPSIVEAVEPYLVGLGALQDDELLAARGSFEKTVELAGDFAPGYEALGWTLWLLYRDTGDEDQLARSTDRLDRAVRMDPQRWRPRFRLGEIQRRTGRDEEAVAMFAGVLRDDPGNPLASRGLSRVYRAQKRFDEADNVLLEVIARRPDYFESHRLLAVHHYRSNEKEDAMRKFRDVLELAPDDAYSLNALAALYHRRGDYAAAVPLFERAYHLLPNCDTCSNVGMVLYYEGRYKESASYYEYAFEYCDENEYENWGNWARVLYWVEGEGERAQEAGEKAIALAEEELLHNPEDWVLLGSLIDYHSMFGDEARARLLIDRALPFAKGNEELLASIGSAYESFGDRNAALRYFGEAVRNGYPLHRIQADPDLAPLIRDPRFRQVPAGSSGGT